MTRDDSARFEVVPGFWSRKWIFFGERTWTRPSHRLVVSSGRRVFSREIPDDELDAILKAQVEIPRIVMDMPERRKIWWAFRNHVYYHSDEERDPEVIKGLIIQKLERDTKRRAKAIDVARRDQK